MIGLMVVVLDGRAQQSVPTIRLSENLAPVRDEDNEIVRQDGRSIHLDAQDKLSDPIIQELGLGSALWLRTMRLKVVEAAMG